jgi:hypothetical protein
MYLSMRKKKMAGKEEKMVSEVFAKFGGFAAVYSNYSQLIRPRKGIVANTSLLKQIHYGVTVASIPHCNENPI